MITDDVLRAAAKEASLALAETLVHGSSQQPPYIPSKSFTCKMSRLCRRERHPVFYRTIQRVAAVFLALLLTAGLRLMRRPVLQQLHGSEAFHRTASYIAS